MRAPIAQASAALLIGACAGSQAVTVPPPGPVDFRVRVASYNPDDVVKLHGYVGYQIHIEWAPGEEFVSLGAGDGASFDIGAEKNHFFIKPKQPQFSTNITVLTTAHTYHFDYTASRLPHRAGLPSDQIYSLRFVYPQDEAQRLATNAARQRLESRMAGSDSRSRNLDYAYCGAPALKPTLAYDDGLQTHLRFAPGGEMPAFFVLNDDQTEGLINFSVERDEVVLHRIARRVVLRSGDLVGCVVNRAYASSAAAPSMHTTAPGVERVMGGNPK
jgi:type IV secretion system protein VirB9